MTESCQKLWHRARRSLEANLEPVGDKVYLTAGRHQFRSLWTRDFCFSVPALLQLGHQQVVQDQLNLILQHAHHRRRILPRTLDSSWTPWRVSREVLRQRFLHRPKALALHPRLRPEYFGEHGFHSFDSGLLVIRAASDYVKATGDHEFAAKWRSTFQELLESYLEPLSKGLIPQLAYSDWQDSVRRKGPVCLTHLLLFDTLGSLAELQLGPSLSERSGWRESLRKKLHEHFFDPEIGLFRIQPGEKRYSLEDQLFAIEFGLVPEPKKFWRHLKGSEFFRRHGVPGFVTFPDYPAKEISWTVKVAGLRHYHDRLLWSWLSALSMRVAKGLGDQDTVSCLTEFLLELTDGKDHIGEIYEFREGKWQLWSSLWLVAECPFSWGAAQIIEALDEALYGAEGVRDENFCAPF